MPLRTTAQEEKIMTSVFSELQGRITWGPKSAENQTVRVAYLKMKYFFSWLEKKREGTQ